MSRPKIVFTGNVSDLKLAIFAEVRDNHIFFDVGEVLRELTALAKLSGRTKEDIIQLFNEAWDETEVMDLTDVQGGMQ